MSDQQGSRPADPTTTANTFRTTTHPHSTELYEATFSTLGRRPRRGRDGQKPSTRPGTTRRHV